MPDKVLNICNLGLLAYKPALAIQYRLLERRQQDLIGDTLLLVEHPPVLTLGARGHAENIYISREKLAEFGVEIHEVNRGGDVTYHGPGQIVGYLIMKIDQIPGSVRGFISTLETGLINLLREEFFIAADRRQNKYTGVWVGERKIVAIGVEVKQWVTMHGFAFNVNTDLGHFDWINPCGLSLGVTSVADLTGRPVDFLGTMNKTGYYLAEAFDRIPIDCRLPELLPNDSRGTGGCE